MFKKVLCFSIFSVMIIACAGSNIGPAKDGSSEELVKSFNLKDEDVKKFIISKKVKKAKKVSGKDKAPKLIVKKNKVLPKSKKSIKEPIADNQKQVNLGESDKTKIGNNKKGLGEKLPDPQEHSDYPNLYKKYNKNFKQYWKQYKPVYFSGEKFKLEISWSLFTAGTATIETIDNLVIDNRDVVGFKTVLRSAEYFEKIYTLKDTLNSYVDKATTTPVKFVMEQRESGQTVDDLQLFDTEKLKTYFLYKRIKKGKTTKKNKESYIPRYFTDSFSALQFLRGLPMKVGNTYEFPVVTRTKVWLLKAEVEKKENIEIMGKKVSAYKVKAETHFPGVLKKRGDIIFWFSSDVVRKFLKFEAKIKIGTVKGVLIDYEEGSSK